MPASRSQIGSMYAGLDGLELCSWPPSSRAGRPSTISCVPVAVARSVGSGRAAAHGCRRLDRAADPGHGVVDDVDAQRVGQRDEVHQAVRQLVAELRRHGVRPGLGLPLHDRRDRADPAGQGQEEVARRLQRRPPVELGEFGEGAAQVGRGRRSRQGRRVVGAEVLEGADQDARRRRPTTPTIRPVMPPATSVERYRPSTRPSSVNARRRRRRPRRCPGPGRGRSCGSRPGSRRISSSPSAGRSASPSTCRMSPTAHTARTRPSATLEVDGVPWGRSARTARRRRRPRAAPAPGRTGAPAAGRRTPAPPSARSPASRRPRADDLRRASGAPRPRTAGSSPPVRSSVTTAGRPRGLDVAGEHRPAVGPDDLVGEGLPAEHVPLRAGAAGPARRGRRSPSRRPGRSTRSACPVFCTGSSVPRCGDQRVGRVALERPLRRARPRAMVTAWPALGAALGDQQVPPVADPVEVRALRGTCRPCPTRATARSVQHLAGQRVDRRLDDALAAVRAEAGVGHQAGAVVVPGEVGVDAHRRRDARRLRPRAGRVVGVRRSAGRRRPPSCVVIIQNRPSWCRSVGREDRRPTGRPSRRRAATAGRATWPICSHERRSVERKIGTPGSVLEAGGDQVVGVVDPADARVGVEAGDHRPLDGSCPHPGALARDDLGHEVEGTGRPARARRAG